MFSSMPVNVTAILCDGRCSLCVGWPSPDPVFVLCSFDDIVMLTALHLTAVARIYCLFNPSPKTSLILLYDEFIIKHEWTYIFIILCTDHQIWWICASNQSIRKVALVLQCETSSTHMLSFQLVIIGLEEVSPSLWLSCNVYIIKRRYIWGCQQIQETIDIKYFVRISHADSWLPGLVALSTIQTFFLPPL